MLIKHKLNFKQKYHKYKTKYLQFNKCNFTKFSSYIVTLSKSPEYNKTCVDYSKFIITPSSVYSCEMPYHMTTWVEILDKLIKNNIKILDMTSNIGSFSINVANYYKKSNINITSVELDKCNFLALQKNIKKFNLSNQIKAIMQDALIFIKSDITYDFIYVDPPWGDNYKDKSEVILQLSNVNILDIIEDIFNRNLTKIILLKAPVNFNYNLTKYKYIKYEFYKPNKEKDVSYIVYLINNN
jgi:16S rRNA G966 N2-methylase RsmD